MPALAAQSLPLCPSLPRLPALLPTFVTPEEILHLPMPRRSERHPCGRSQSLLETTDPRNLRRRRGRIVPRIPKVFWSATWLPRSRWKEGSAGVLSPLFRALTRRTVNLGLGFRGLIFRSRGEGPRRLVVPCQTPQREGRMDRPVGAALER